MSFFSLKLSLWPLPVFPPPSLIPFPSTKPQLQRCNCCAAHLVPVMHPAVAAQAPNHGRTPARHGGPQPVSDPMLQLETPCASVWCGPVAAVGKQWESSGKEEQHMDVVGEHVTGVYVCVSACKKL